MPSYDRHPHTQASPHLCECLYDLVWRHRPHLLVPGGMTNGMHVPAPKVVVAHPPDALLVLDQSKGGRPVRSFR